MGWIAVDFDGTLAEYHGWAGGHLGAPIPAMVDRVKLWLEEGKDVRIFTARVSTPVLETRQAEVRAIEAWCEKHIGRVLPITNAKDYAMEELWDDRAVEVKTNTGEPVNLMRRRHE
jgi:hypothetical protein